LLFLSPPQAKHHYLILQLEFKNSFPKQSNHTSSSSARGMSAATTASLKIETCYSGADEFELEENVFGAAPIGVHCVDASSYGGVILWANRTELNFLGFTTIDEYVGRCVSSSSAGVVLPDDRTLYEEILRRVTTGNAVKEILVRFVTRSGATVHLLLDCDGIAIKRRGGAATASSSTPPSYYYRFFTRDDTARRIQEMRSNVSFQETNRSLRMLDDFMNRSLQQIRTPFELMERACKLVAENIEDIDEVVRKNSAAAYSFMINIVSNGVGNSNNVAPALTSLRTIGGANNTPTTTNNNNNNNHNNISSIIGNNPPIDNAVSNLLNFTAPLTTALEATSEARLVVKLANTLTTDALALVDDITDLCRFDQGRVLLVEKEAIKIRDICVEALNIVSSSSSLSSSGRLSTIPTMGGGAGSVEEEELPMVDIIFDVQEGSPGRVITDRGVLQRCLAILLNFAIDAAAANAATTTEVGKGKVILSIQEASTSSCKVSVFYTNSPDDGSGGMNTSVGSEPLGETSAFASAYATSSSNSNSMGGFSNDINNLQPATNVNGISNNANFSMKFSPAIDGVGIPQPNEDPELLQKYHSSTQGSTSMMRRIKLKESIYNGMTGCRRDKLRVGMDLLHHLVGAQMSDLRCEIVSEEQQHGGGIEPSTMTKFWFLLPISIDFPDRLPAEQFIVKNGLHTAKSPHLLSNPLPTRSSSTTSASTVPPENGMAVQQPLHKRVKFSHQPISSLSLASASEPLVSLKSNNEALTGQYPGVAPGARPLVLVVEDTDVSASLLCMHLRKLNCTSHRAENGEVAIEMLRSAPAPNMYSLILMDLRMPVLDGFEATKIIKSSNAGNIPVVALTGESSEEIRQQCDEIGFEDFKTKPLTRQQLEELLFKFVPGYTKIS
jgi:CheY-like chemotaxis protein